MKLGKLPATHDERDLKFAKYASTVVLPKVPSRFGFGTLYGGDWGMLGNNSVGCCTIAGAAHETMLWNRIGGHPVNMTAPWVIGDYSAVTGYNPNDPSSDRGANVRDVLKFRTVTGVADGHGLRHKIAAYVALDAKDWDQLLLATYIFGAVGIGFEFPASAMDQFNAGQVWNVVPGSPIEGGHYVPIVGTMARTKRATCVTWGARQELTKAFYLEHNDEAYALLSEEQLRSDGRGLHNFDLATLRADLAAL